MLDFYAEDARLSIVNHGVSQGLPFELRGRAEIAKHLRASFGPETSHRVERGVVGEGRVTFREACEYPDGGRVVVETTLEVRDGKIVRHVEVVARDAGRTAWERSAQAHPYPQNHPNPHPGVDASPPNRLLRSEQPREKEDSE